MLKRHGHGSDSDVPTNDDTFVWDSNAGSAVDPFANAGQPAERGKPGSVLTTYTSGDPTVADASEFNIQIDFSGNWTAKQQAVVTWAADFYSKIITADIHDDFNLNGVLVDDVVLSLSAGRIDGKGSPLTGNILAQTGNFVVRDPGTANEWLPLTASIKLDSTDLKNAALSGTWDAIVAHEMGHALGFVGGIFNLLGLVDSAGNFAGTNAVAAYGGAVPLEHVPGAVGSHWDEAAFAPNGVQMSNDLMTGFFVPGEQTLLSDTTLGAFQDLGYTVADPDPTQNFYVVDSHLLVI